ncbi:hypothetical protein ACNF49_21685 [Actinomadura sp. ATCC 39365]
MIAKRRAVLDATLAVDDVSLDAALNAPTITIAEVDARIGCDVEEYGTWIQDPGVMSPFFGCR